jgi:hypothetical protein
VIRVTDSGTPTDDLVAQAKARAEGGGAVDESWGDLIQLDEGESFVGRYRGHANDPKHDRLIYLFWDVEGAPCWSRYYAALGRELEGAAPMIGDRVAIHRGPNYKTGHEEPGEPPKGQSYGVVCEPSSDPLPDEEPQPATSTLAGAGKPAARDDIPF